jgi:hypothetical protein
MPSHSHFFSVEFCAGNALDDCSVRIESIQPAFCEPSELWLQSLKTPARDAATNALPAMRHEEIDVVGPRFPMA